MSLLRLLPRASLAARQPVRLGSLCTTRALSESEIKTMVSTDLKASLRAKDKTRCAVLRSILNEVAEASRNSKPIDSDAALHALLRKSMKTSAKAIEDFTKANREDMVEKEKAEIAVMEEYVGKLNVVGEEEMDQAIARAIEKLKADGQPVKKAAVRQLVFIQLKDRAMDKQSAIEKINAAAPE